jgi:hypothetical protein
MAEALQGRCHCGGVTLSVPGPPAEVTQCGCSICRRIGALWAYYPVGQVAIRGETHDYVWGRRYITFRRCAQCGCVIAWTPRGVHPECGVNARMLDGFDLGSARLIVEEDASC